MTTETALRQNQRWPLERYRRILRMLDGGATIKDIILAEGVKRGMAYHLVKMTRLYKARGWL